MFQKDNTKLKERNNSLFVFVGEKYSVTKLPQVISYDGYISDEIYIAKYKFIKSVYGYYPNDTIEFIAHDYYGKPGFSNYKHALLFVTKNGNNFYHLKYQYFDVYKLKNGKWASPYKYYQDSIKPIAMTFPSQVFYPTGYIDEEGKWQKSIFSTPYYKIVSNKAIPLYGNYIEDLFLFKKESYLKFKGLFGKDDENWEDSINIIDTEMAPILPDSTK